MSLPVYMLIGSTITLVILAGVFRVEDKRAQKVLLPRLRNALDAFLLRRMGAHAFASSHVGQGFFRLLFHYFAHGVLNRVLAAIRWIEIRVESLIRQNRQIAKTIGAQKRETHLTAIAEHKAQTALTEREKQKLRAHH